MHGDPVYDAFRLDPATGRIGVIDWGSAGLGPLLYDVATATMYAGGPEQAGEFLDAYASAGVVPFAEIESALGTLLRFRWAVQADYFAARIAADDRTGLTDPAGNLAGLNDARIALLH